jgi:hypothetical protein
MDFATVSGADMRAAQMLSGVTFAIFLMVSLVPGLRAHATRIRLAIAVLYCIAATGFALYVLAR